MVYALLWIIILLQAGLLIKSFMGSPDDKIHEQLEHMKTELIQQESQQLEQVKGELLQKESQQLEHMKMELLQQEADGQLKTQQAVMASVSTMGQSLGTNVHTMGQTLDRSIQNMKTVITEGQKNAAAVQSEKLEHIDRHVIARQEAMNQNVEQQMKAMELRIRNLEDMSEKKLDALRQSMQTAMQEMRQGNEKKLDEIRGTVEEKLQDTLQKRISESFATVSNELEKVYKGLGEMQHLASDVGGLKQVLSGVKTRGILGEIQLGAILEEILSPEQYATNVATIPGAKERVEFAVKLPGSDGGHVYLPIDSKFPGDTYMHLQEAITSGDTVAVGEARKALETVLKKSAKDIRDKYVEPPYTTTFGILFLPFEGLYAEVVNMGMIERLQRDYGINVAGPSTMAALLNSLQMGFRTLAIQKRSNEVWQVLGAVKTEFEKFEGVMEKMQNHLQQTSSDLETLMGTRTRAINRKLKSVQQLDDASSQKLLENEDV